MTKPKHSVSFNQREHRSSEDMSRSPVRSNGAKSPTRNGSMHKSDRHERPGVDRTDTSASGWATDNEEDEKVRTDVLYE